MSDIDPLLRQLEAYVQEEIGAQGRTLGLLEAQERAILSGEPNAVAERARAIDADLRQAAARAQRRTELLRRFAQRWGVAAGALTLASVLERAGAEGRRLERQRSDLRQAAARVARQGRRTASVARFQQRLVGELIGALLAPGEREGAPEGGRLVDAEA